jgi:hypothetical protein
MSWLEVLPLLPFHYDALSDAGYAVEPPHADTRQIVRLA